MKRVTQHDHSEYMSLDDYLSSAQMELTDALLALYETLKQGPSHMEFNVNVAAEHVMKAGRMIEHIRGKRRH